MSNKSDTKLGKTIMKNLENDMAKNTVVANTVVENETVVLPSIKFVPSEDIQGAIKCVVFLPENYSGKYANVDLFDAKSAMTAIVEYLGKTVLSGGELVHVRSQEHSLYDGLRTFYLGGGIVKDAIENGDKSMVVNVAGKKYNVSLPSTTSNLGSWVKVNTRLGDWARAVPGVDNWNVVNLDKKHHALEALFRGTKLVIYTEPTLVAGEVKGEYSQRAKDVSAMILNKDGSLKTSGEIATAYFEGKREYVGQNKLQKQADKMAKISPVLQLSVATQILVDGSMVSIDDVVPGRYIVKTSDNKESPLTVLRNADSYNQVVLLATRGCTLELQRAY